MPTAQISDNAVLKATGKNWQEWFSLILKTGGKNLTHQQIVKIVHNEINGSGWWAQMVTVEFEKKYKKRILYQAGNSFKVSIAKVFNFAVDIIYNAFIDEKKRAKWLSSKQITIRKATKNKSLRITWHDKITDLDVNLYPKGKDKTNISAQFSKLKSAEVCEKKKIFMKKAYSKLEKLISN